MIPHPWQRTGGTANFLCWACCCVLRYSHMLMSSSASFCACCMHQHSHTQQASLHYFVHAACISTATRTVSSSAPFAVCTGTGTYTHAQQAALHHYAHAACTGTGTDTRTVSVYATIERHEAAMAASKQSIE
eukprot:1160912-Pelagomonas_calceolata.AAC.5